MGGGWSKNIEYYAAVLLYLIPVASKKKTTKDREGNKGGVGHTQVYYVDIRTQTIASHTRSNIHTYILTCLPTLTTHFCVHILLTIRVFHLHA